MLLALDIWQEIIDYFEYPRDSYTLKCLALTSKTISDLAIYAIWREGKRFLNIVSVINSFVVPPDEPFLKLGYATYPGYASEESAESSDNYEDKRQLITEVGWVNLYIYSARYFETDLGCQLGAE